MPDGCDDGCGNKVAAAAGVGIGIGLLLGFLGARAMSNNDRSSTRVTVLTRDDQGRIIDIVER